MKKIKRIPYMGSKNKIAGWVCSNILENLDTEKEYDFLDIFGGGGSVTTTMAEQLTPFNNIYYNEKNEAVFNLFTLLVNGNPDTKKEFLEERLTWVSRETFKKEHIGNSAYAGYLQTCWTFGNNQKDYIYGVQIEQAKKETHDIIVNFSKETALKYGLILDYSFYDEPDIARRVSVFKKAVKNRLASFSSVELESFENAKKLLPAKKREFKYNEAISFTSWFREQNVTHKQAGTVTNSQMASHWFSLGSQPSVPNPEQWEKLKPLLTTPIPEHINKVIYSPVTEKEIWAQVYNNKYSDFKLLWVLNQMLTLNSLQRFFSILNLSTIQPNLIKTTNLDYKDVTLKPNTVIYCDAPYNETVEYKEGSFNNEEYLNWLQELTKKNIPVFVSEYNLNLEGFKEISAVKKQSLLNKNKTGSKMERLYWNGLK